MTLFADQSRDALRASWREAWRKWRERVPLQPLEAQIADVIAEHPEYQPLLQSETALQQDFPGHGAAENPFLHMGLHLALREQLNTDRPRGIAAMHRRLAASLQSAHAAEHRMIEVLAGILWEAHRGGHDADEALYLERLRRL
ncbi:MAG: DUF1841 family protein [Steroidobacterales bacterium]